MKGLPSSTGAIQTSLGRRPRCTDAEGGRALKARHINVRAAFVRPLTTTALSLLLLGCHSTPGATNIRINATGKPSFRYPPRPATPAPPVKVFHHTDTSLTLTTNADASNDQIEALVWQLRDAAHTHTLAKLGIDQAFVDHNKPSTWFHIYRGTKCAAEKYAAGSPPCGPSYHAAADYTLGTPGNPAWDNGILLTPKPGSDDPTETPLWDPDTSYTGH